MLRTSATRSLLRGFTKLPAARSAYITASPKLQKAPLRQLNNKRSQVVLSLARPTITTLFYTTKTPSPYDPISPKEEQKVLESKIKPVPEEVSSSSSVRNIFEGSQAEKKDGDEMLGAIKADMGTIKETFALTEVPRESLYIGVAGVIPYAVTSLSTVFLAYEINHASETGVGHFFTPEKAHQLLDLVTPIQIGYGAVIISFLGAIHWGLEYAGYGGYHSYRRYIYGVIAPAVAWPTIFMPVEYALITQFLAFNFLYFADARATVRGWFPPWYSTYRFVLTFFVGASIVISLVGRGQIVQQDRSLRSPEDYVKKDRDLQWVALEREEKERRAKLVEGDEESEEGGDDEGKEGEKDESKEKEDETSEKDDKKNNKKEKI